MFYLEKVRERERSSRRRSRALLQVSGVGVIEDVHVKIGVGDEARWPDSTSPIARAYTHLQDILHYIVLIADLLFGSYQVRHAGFIFFRF